MAKQKFEWNPDLGAENQVKPRVTVTKFGDGYESRVAVGINSKPKSWRVTFTRNYPEFSQILAFIEARGGVDAFEWKDPLNQTGIYVARDWSYTQQSPGVYKLTATFDQVFEY